MVLPFATLLATPALAAGDSDRGDGGVEPLPREDFRKIGRFELAPHLGAVTNDPDLNRYLLGAGLTGWLDQMFGVELTGTWSPTLGDLDYKAVTKQITYDILDMKDLSRIRFVTSLNLVFAPLFGEVRVGRTVAGFDLFGVVGTGLVETADDLVAMYQTEDPSANATQVQLHPTLDLGAGLRVTFTRTTALRLEWRQLSYVEVFDSTRLDLRNTATVLTSVSLYFPRARRPEPGVDG